MNTNDRRISLFLSISFFMIGLYMGIQSSWKIIVSESDSLFQFENQNILVFRYIAQLLIGLVSTLTGFAMWLRVSWSTGLAIFASGLLIAFTLNNMGRVIYSNPPEAIFMAVILIILFQSFPFLMRKTNRSL